MHTTRLPILRGDVGEDAVKQHSLSLDTEPSTDALIEATLDLLCQLAGVDEEDDYRAVVCVDTRFVALNHAGNQETVDAESVPGDIIIQSGEDSIEQREHAAVIQLDKSRLCLRYSPRFFTESSSSVFLAQLSALLQGQGSTLKNSTKTILNRDCKAKDSLLHALLAQFANSATTALSFSTSIDKDPYELSYLQLHKLSNQLAAQLVALKLHAKVIPVLLPQSPELYIALLAILKSGNVYCPLLVDTPAERVAFVCQDVEAQYAFGNADLLPGGVQALKVSLEDSYDSFTAPDIDLNTLAYVMYTSGSTGKPKAVQITHRNASTSILAHNFIFDDTQFAQGDRFLQFANSTFDISIFEIFSCWARGMTLVAADRSLLLATLPELLEKRRVNYLELTPSVAGLLPNQHDPRFVNIKALITIGEMLTPQVLANWAGKLYNAYGPTEATLHATVKRMDKVDALPANIGGPLASCSIAILDPNSTDVLPFGWLGELCIGGPQVALGYLHRQDLTEAAFITHPCFDTPLYRTGDLARIVDGEVIFVGRKQGDAQVKINGQRIELGEIAHAIEHHKGAQHCAVIKLDRLLYAFVVGDPSFKLCGRLPLDVKPVVKLLDALPTSSSGKLDTKALKALAQEHADARPEQMDAESMSEDQELVSTATQSVLGIPVGLNGSLAQHGLDSLGAIKIVMALRQHGKSCSVYDVLDADTIGGIARKLTLAATEAKPSTGASLAENELARLEKIYQDCTFAPCSDIQEAMLAGGLADSNGQLYFNHVLIKLEESDFERFCTAWRSLVERHSILRTGFVSAEEGDGEFIQVIYPSTYTTQVEQSHESVEGAVAKHKARKLSVEDLATPPLHVLVLDDQVSIMLHHALYDAWSLELMLDDLQSLLREKTLEPAPQYAQIVQNLPQLNLNSARDYWTRQLKSLNCPPLPILAQFEPEVNEPITTSLLSSTSLQDLDAKASALGASPQAIGQLTWSLLLKWYTGEESAFAITTSGRTLPVAHIDRVVGPFISTYPCLISTNNEMTIVDALKLISDGNKALLEHRLPYREILKLAETRQVPKALFIYQKTGADIGQSGIRVLEQEDRLEFQILLTFDRANEGLRLNISARPGLVAPNAALVLLQQVDCLLRTVLENSNAPVAALKLLPKELLSIDNVHHKAAIHGRLDASFASLAQSQPDAPALEFYDSLEHSIILSYADLNQAANKLANYLCDSVSAEEPVGICMDKSIAMYASMLAIHKLGCPYLALDPALPAERIKVILEVTGTTHVLSTAAHLVRFISEHVHDAEAILQVRSRSEFEACSSGQLAYILMTSGTTGVPKGCAVEHSNVLSNIDVLSQIYPHQHGDRIMQFTSYAFDVSVFEIWFAWLNGYCLVSAQRDLLLSDLPAAFNAFKVTHIDMTPMAAALVRADELPNVRCFILTGEAINRSIVQEWGASGRCYNAYGPTEATNVCTVKRLTTARDYASSIGRVLPNTSGFVLDDSLQLLPRFTVGELWVGGAQVIRGYVNNAERTAQSFVQHPELGRIYRTGDVVRMLDDGSISFLGRADTQVKIRGYRIELDEVTHAVKQHKKVSDAATIVQDSELVSFIATTAPQGDWQDVVTEVFRSCGKALPSYMVPAMILPLDAIPHTATFKLDSRRLRTLYDEYHDRDQFTQAHDGSEDANWTDASRMIARIFSDTSGVPLSKISPGVSMYKLGMDSISAIKIATAARKAGLGALKISDIMSNLSPAKIGRVVDAKAEVRPTEDVTLSTDVVRQVLQDLDLEPAMVEDVLPCTPLQEGILLETLKSDSVHYVNHQIVTLQAGIDSVRLRKACQALVNLNPMLRTCFGFTSHSDHPCAQVSLREIDVDWTVSSSDAAFEDHKQRTQRDFTLRRPPLAFLEIQGAAHQLVISLHHALFDGWSLSLMLDDLSSLYHAETVPTRVPLKTVLGEIFQPIAHHTEAFWRAEFDGFDPTPFPCLSDTCQHKQEITERNCTVKLSTLMNRSKASARPLLSILQAAWAVLLSSVTGSEDVCFANVVSGRTVAVDGIEGIVAPLFNAMPLRARVHAGDSLESLLEDLQRANLKHLEAPHFPLRRILKLAGVDGTQLFDTILILQKPVEREETPLYNALDDEGDSNYAIMLEFIPHTETDLLKIRLTAQENLVPSIVARELTQKLEHLIDAISQDSSRSIGTLDNDASAITKPVTYRPNSSLFDAFLRNCKLQPSAPALDFLQESGEILSFTYASLLVEISHVSAHLQQMQLDHGAPIAVMLGKSPGLYIAFLAILHAGLVYVPLDPTTPPDRLKHILEELQPALVLTDDESRCTEVSGKMQSLSTWLEDPRRHSEPASVKPDDVAYIIYTSGSTGTPKAVVLEHGAAVAAIEGSKPVIWCGTSSRWLQFASSTFDMSIYDMSIAFSFGMCLCASTKNAMLADLSSVIRTLSVTHLDLTPSVARTIRRADLPEVEMLFCIGERLSQGLVSEWQQLCLNTYGPTEAAMVCTSRRMRESSLAHNIGLPFEHAQLGIFQVNDSQPLSTLSLGELCIAGPQLSRGYFKDAKKTRQAFFEHNGSRFYRTGDLCRMMPDSQILFAGRKDNQTKLRGQRVELDEISALLLRADDAIKATSTIICPSADGVEQLLAFLAPTATSTEVSSLAKVIDPFVPLEQVLEKLERQLPMYMVPASLVCVNFLPLGNAGKLDNRRLLDLATEALQVSIAPEQESMTESEMLVAEVFAQLSSAKLEVLGRTSTLYQLGLDSIAAIRVVAALKQRHKHVNVVDVLQYPSVEKLAKKLAVTTNAVPAVPAFGEKFTLFAERLGTCDPRARMVVPCTPVQENMIAQFIRSGGSAYYNHIAFDIARDADMIAMRDAWTSVTLKYDILQAYFVSVDMPNCQYALALPKAPHDFSVSLEVPEMQSAIDKTMEDLQSALFDDITHPSFRLTFLTCGTSRKLLFSAHHALYDGETLNSIFAAVQSSLQGTHPVTMASLADSAKKLWHLYSEPQAQESAAFWKSRLMDTSSNAFPNLSNRVVEQESSIFVAKHNFPFIEAETLCKKLGFSLAHASMAAWAKILSSYTGESQVSFGVITSGRLGLDLDDALFPATSTLPFSCLLNTSAAQAVESLAQQYASAMTHQHVNLSKLAPADGTLFDTLFAFQKRSDETPLDGKFWRIAQEYASVEVPISLEVIPGADSNLAVHLTHTNKLPASHASLILKQFEAILKAILHFPATSMLDLELHLDQRLLAVLPPKIPLFDCKAKFLHQFVERFAVETPQACALEFVSDLASQSRLWTYEKLNADANRLAHRLCEQPRSAKPIAICFDKCPEAFIAILAVLKLGSPFCCLDPSAPLERRKFIVENSESCQVLCGQPYAEELTASVTVPVLALPVNLEAYPVENIDAQEAGLDHEDALAYVLYTSGSTGTPKGCCLTHKNIVQALCSFQHEFCGQFDSNSRFLAFAGLHFDVSILEQYFSWSIGARVCAAPKDVMLSDIPGTIQRFGVTHLDLTPQLAMTLLPEEAPTLRVFITGGEMLRSETVEHWGDSDVLFNFYGPTEATIGCTALKQVPKGTRPSNIGQQWKNCGSIVQSMLGVPKPALRGGLGDLFISGCQVGAGYMNLPDATSKRFGYSEILQSPTYQTGDLVRLLEVDASFDFVGRADQQVKLRGQRIETGEIDAVIKRAHPSVRAAVTVVLKHRDQTKEHLVTWVEYHDADQTAEATLIKDKLDRSLLFAAAQQALPVYMVPSYIVPLGRIKLTATNKVDLKHLQLLYNEMEMNSLAQYTPARRTTSANVSSEILRKVKLSLSGMSGIDEANISNDTTIFEIGLDSVSVVGFVRQLRKSGLSHATVAQMMHAASVLEIASVLSQPSQGVTRSQLNVVASFNEANRKKVCDVLQIPESAFEGVLPCTPLVEGLLVESINSSVKLHYNTFTIESAQALDSARLRGAFDNLIKQVPILRSRFVLVPEGIAHAIVQQDIEKGLINSRRFPLETRLIELDVNGKFASVTLHHALYDGHSLSLLLRHFQALYDNPAAVLDVPSFAEAVEEILKLDIAAAKMFWTDYLGSAKIASFERVHAQSDEATANFELSVSPLQEYCKSKSCTAIAVLQAAWAIVLRHLLGVDAIFGLVVSGRNLACDGIEEMVFPTFNTLPSFVETQGRPIGDVVADCQKAYGQASAFEHTPQRVIKKALQVPSDVKLMDAILVFQHEESLDQQKEPWTLRSVSDDDTGFALALDVTSGPAGLKILVKTTGINVAAQSVLQNFEYVLRSTLVGEIAECDLYPLPVSETMLKRSKDSNTSPFNATSSTAQIIMREVAALQKMDVAELEPQVSFFTLGLDSIDMIKLAARLKSNDLIVSVADLMAHASVADLTGHIESTQSASLQSHETDWKSLFPEISGEDVEDVLPCSPVQEGMLIEDRVNGTLRYLNHSLLRLAQDVSIERLERAWNAVVRANAILRTHFTHVDKDGAQCRFLQIVSTADDFLLRRSSIENEDEAFERQVSWAKATCDSCSTVPFLLQCFQKKDCWFLAISIHHALYDGIALDQIYNDVQAAYDCDGDAPARPSYRLLIEHIHRQPVASAELFWTRHLRGCVPQLAKRALDAGNTIKVQHFSGNSMHDLKQTSRALGVAPQAIVQATFARVLMKMQHQADVLFGTIQAGRSFAQEADEVVGPCMNTVPLRAYVAQTDTIEDLTQALHQTNIDMVPHIHTPLGRIQRLAGQGLLFDCLLVVQNALRSRRQFKLWQSVRESSSVEFPLAVECELGDKITWTLAAHGNFLPDGDSFLIKLDQALGHTLANTSALVLEGVDLDSTVAPNSSTDEICDEEESKLAAIVADVAGVQLVEIRPNTSIFTLGLDSISAVELSKKLRSQGQLISVANILRNPSVREMNLAIKAGNSHEQRKSKSPVLVQEINLAAVATTLDCTTTDIQKVLPVTATQAYFFSAWASLNGGRFMSNFAFKVEGDKDLLTSRWRHLLSQADVLRTAFLEQKGRLCQVVLSLRLCEDPVTHSFDCILDEAIQRFYSSDEFLAPSLKRGPAHLVFIAAQDGMALLLMVHHVLYDAFSIDLLIRALQTDDTAFVPYSAFVEDFAEPDESSLAFWKGYLSNVEPFSLAPQNSSNVRQILEKLSLRSPSPKQLDYMSCSYDPAPLHQKAQKLGITTQSLLLSSVGKVMGRRQGRSSIVLGLYVAGRGLDFDNINQLMGPTVNVLPVRMNLTASLCEKQVHQDIISMNGRMQQVSIADMHRVAGLRSEGGLVDVTLNVLPRASQQQPSEGQTLFDMGRLSPECIGAIRQQYMAAFDQHSRRFSQLDHHILHAVKPVLDIEVSYSPTGDSLSFGIFCAESLLSAAQAEELVQNVWRLAVE